MARGTSTPSCVGERDRERQVLLPQRPDVVEHAVPEVVVVERRGGGAVHDRARAAGDRVGVPDHLAELDQVESGGLGQPLRLGRGGERDEVHQVAGQLHPGAGAERPGVDDLAAHQRERRPRGGEGLVGPADHDRQRAVGGAHRRRR